MLHRLHQFRRWAGVDRAVQTVEDTLRSQGYAEVGHIVEFFGKSPAAHRAEASVPAVPAT